MGPVDNKSTEHEEKINAYISKAPKPTKCLTIKLAASQRRMVQDN